MKPTTTIETRIRVVEGIGAGADLIYTTDINELRLLPLERKTEPHEYTFLSVGTLISCLDPDTGTRKEYKIIKVNTKLWGQRNENSSNKGINIYGQGEDNPFVLDVIYIVQEKEI